MTASGDFPPMLPVSPGEYEKQHEGVIGVVIGLAIGLPVVGVLAVVLLFVSSFGAFRPNTAHVAAEPIVTALQNRGASVICDDGDPGYGPDNIQPWYIAYVAVPDPAAGRSALLTAARKQHLALRAQVGSQVTDASFDLTSAPVIVTDESANEERLDVHATAQGAVSLDCSGRRWGSSQTPEPGESIYEIRITEPDNTL